MGQTISALDIGIKPTPPKVSTFDPLLGFPEGRKERVMKVTQAELESAQVPLEERGFCAHHYIAYNTCRRDVWPFAYRCGHEKHEYLNCRYDDYVIRMKEFEREKRLQARQKRIDARQRAESI